MSENAPEAPAAAVEPPGEAPKMFTQEQVNSMLARQKRDEFGDYGDLKAKASEYDKLAESQKTEQQRMQESLEAQRRDLEAAQRDATRLRVALDHGLSTDEISRLAGGSEDELKANAEWLASLRAANTQPPAPEPVKPTQRPAEQLRPGATPANEVSDDDEFYRSLFPDAAQ